MNSWKNFFADGFSCSFFVSQVSGYFVFFKGRNYVCVISHTPVIPVFQGHFGVPKESIFQNCQLTSNSGYFDIRGTEKLDIQLSGVKPNTRYAIEVFAKPVNGFYSIGIWTKVDTVFEVTTPAECSTAYTMSQQNVDAD